MRTKFWLSIAAILALAYMLVSFVAWDLSPYGWGFDGRMVYLLVVMGLIFIGALIAAPTTGKRY